MEQGTIIAFLAVGASIFIGFFGNLIFTRYRIPDVLIMIILGVVIGPDVLGLVGISGLDSINQYRDIFLSVALVLILFDGGLTLDLRAVLESMRLATFVTVINMALEVLVVGVALHLIFDIDLVLSFVFATIVGGTSSAIVIPITNKMRIKPRTKAMLVWESVLTDVLVITVALSLMSLIEVGDFSLLTMAEEIAVKFLVGAAIGFAAGILWLFALQKLEKQPLSYMLTVGALFAIAAAVEMDPINSSGAVAALMFGLALGNRKDVKRWLTSVTLHQHSSGHIEEFHSEISFFVRTFFFVYLGLLIRFDTFTITHLAVGIGIIAVVVVVRRMTASLATRVGDLDKEESDAVFGMMARGLAAAVLATTPAVVLAGTDVWEPEYEAFILNVTLVVIVGTTVVTTILSFFAERGIDARNRKELRRKLTEETETT
ncbi:MAG: cation:proton antiporter [Thermoplasmata archaeon]|jgi:cell volume regulation protein A|nr:cation:proton antiporter [Thermoplasmata archaeon]